MNPSVATKSFKTETESDVGRQIERIFRASSDSVEVRLQNFPKYVRRQHLKRFLVLYELFKRVLPVKGSIVECGVYRGFGLMSWAKLSAILEPENLTRRVYGFDTFEGFPAIPANDSAPGADPERADLHGSGLEELQALIGEFDRDRFLGHIAKVQLVKGDLVETVPRFLQENPHLLVSLLFLDCDLFEPTRVALETFVPRMPRGAVIAFDELDNPQWPGETLALIQALGVRSFALTRLEWDPYIAFGVVE